MTDAGDPSPGADIPHKHPKSPPIDFEMPRRVERADIPRLCKRLRAALREGNAPLVVCDVGSVEWPDAVIVDALARLQLTARRFGCEVRLRQVREELEGLLSLMGMRDVLPQYEP